MNSSYEFSPAVPIAVENGFASLGSGNFEECKVLRCWVSSEFIEKLCFSEKLNSFVINQK
ncbi:hypothetical protein PGB90_005512 [Kerria lacca]